MQSTLADDGFLHVGSIALDPPSTVSVHFDLNEARSWRNAIFAFRLGGKVVKIGVAAILVQRMLQWKKDLSRALVGDFRTGGPNPWEAYEWRRRLRRNRLGELWVKQGPSNRMLVVGQEKKLIVKYDPILCNDGPRGCKRPQKARMVRNVAEAKAYWEQLNSGGGCETWDHKTPRVINIRMTTPTSSRTLAAESANCASSLVTPKRK